MLVTIIQIAAMLNGVNPDVLVSLCTVETHLRNVINHQDGNSASYGICQVKLETAKMFSPNITAKDLMKPEINADIAAKYLRKQIDRYEGDVHCGLAAYNAGRCNKNDFGVIRNVKYVNKVKNVCTTMRGAKCLTAL